MSIQQDLKFKRYQNYTVRKLMILTLSCW